ncbi:hypothetical protein JGUZn3_03920 [Entomobacter blattae]|uniref:GDP-mannose pyrophosphatase n=2 Tax=Entomobacter blattae TaxID=2762277 RepID=A0A7H1NPD3_9PROT|nr:hypothetical protein JGUZn3_03920 [Entomobacter blattae]
MALKKTSNGTTILSTRTAYENRWLKIREDILLYPNGKEGLYGIVERGEFAVIFPLGDGPEGKTVTLVNQYRYPVDKSLWELPMGMWELNPTAAPEDVARGELEEETGLRAQHIQNVGSFYQGAGYSNQKGHVFLATGLSQHATQRESTEIDMMTKTFPLSEMTNMIERGEIVCMVSIAAYGVLCAKKLI